MSVEKNRKRKLTKQEVADEYVRLYNELGRLPKSRELASMSKFSKDTYKKYLGDKEEMLRFCGLEHEIPNITIRKELTDEECLRLLKEETEKKLYKQMKLLTAHEIDKNKNMPSMDVYTRHFGGIKKAYKLIGVDYDKLNEEMLKADLIQEYIDMSVKLNKTPTIYEYDKYSKLKGYRAVSAIFGDSFINFQKACELSLNSHGKPHYNKEELADKLLKLYNEINRKPTQLDINNCDYLPNMSTISHYFGSLTQALKYIGIPENVMKCKEHVTPNGTLCLSRYEYLFARMLETKNIKFEKEVPYRKYIPDLREWWRFDFEVELNNNIYLVEIFGITENEDYYNKIKRKKNTAEENKLNMICIYPDDIMYKNYNEIYDMFVNKTIHFEDELDDLFNIDE